MTTLTQETRDKRIKQWRIWKAILHAAPERYRITRDTYGGYRTRLEEWQHGEWKSVDSQDHVLYLTDSGVWWQGFV